MFTDIFQDRCSLNVRKFHRKRPVLESLNNKVAGIKKAQKETPAQVFSSKICEIFKNTFYKAPPPAPSVIHLSNYCYKLLKSTSILISLKNTFRQLKLPFSLIFVILFKIHQSFKPCTKTVARRRSIKVFHKTLKIQRKSPAMEFFLVERTETIMSAFLRIFWNFSEYLFRTKLIIDCLCK